MVVATCTAHRNSQERSANRIDLFVNDIASFFDRILFRIDFDSKCQKCCGINLVVEKVCIVTFQKVTSNLLMDKGVVRGV